MRGRDRAQPFGAGTHQRLRDREINASGFIRGRGFFIIQIVFIDERGIARAQYIGEAESLIHVIQQPAPDFSVGRAVIGHERRS